MNEQQIRENISKNHEQARRALAKYGIDCPPFTIYQDEHEASTAARWSRATHTILVNAACSAWRDPAADVLKQWHAKHLSSAAPTHYLVHEVGHALHAPVTLTFGLPAPSPSQSYDCLRRFEIAESVSAYATSSGSEFMAECFAALVDGRPLPDIAAYLYRELGGIVPRVLPAPPPRKGMWARIVETLKGWEPTTSSPSR